MGKMHIMQRNFQRKIEGASGELMVKLDFAYGPY